MSNLSELFPTGGGIELIRTDIITATGTYTKPLDVEDTDVAFVEMWSGGSSGQYKIGTANADGGFPGIWLLLKIQAKYLPATVDVVIGAGGAPSTTADATRPGGDTSFLVWTAPAVPLGPLVGANWRNRIRRLFDGAIQQGTQYWHSDRPARQELIQWEFPIAFDAAVEDETFGSFRAAAPLRSFHSGGWGGEGRASDPSADGKPSVWGGAGGNGGRSGERAAGAGQIPGGGGGGGVQQASGAGARGEIRVHYYRGVSF